MKHVAKWMAAVALVLTFVESALPAEAEEKARYVVLTSDETTVGSLEARYPELAGRWAEIATFNLLRSGRAIEIPESMLASDGVLARVASFYGDAEIRRSFEDRFVPVVPNLLVRKGDEIRTWRGAGVRLLFDDGNYVVLRSQSRAKIVSLGSDDRAAAAPRLRLSLEEGSLWSEIEHEIRGRYEIRTSTASTIIRGTSFRVKVEPGEATRVEVLEGSVDVEVGASRVSVGTREGALAAAGGALPATEPLPNAPELATPLPEEVIARDELDQLFSWTPVDNADGYVFELARDSSFFDVVAERRVGSEASLRLHALEAGTYFWRVSTVSASGFEGAPSEERYFVFVQRRP